MSLSNAQRAILRDMAGGAKLEQKVGSTRYVLKREDRQFAEFVSKADGDNLNRCGMVGRQPRTENIWIFTLTPAGAEAAREGTE